MRNFPVLHTEASDFGDDFGVMAEAAKMLELAEDVINLKDDSRDTPDEDGDALYKRKI